MEKILVIQTAFIGDAILTLPMIQKLKELNQDSQIDVIAIPSTKLLFEASPAVSNVIVLDKRGRHKSLFSIWKFAREIRAQNYSKLYSPHRSFRSSLVTLLSEVRETFGFDNSALPHIYKYLAVYRNDFHEVRRNLELIGCKTDENSWKIKPELSVSKERVESVENFIAEKGITNFIAIAPGSVWETKKYPEKHFIELIDKMSSRNLHVVLIGSEKDDDLCNRIVSASGQNVFSSAGKFDLIETAELLKRAELLVCNDSAPTHLGMTADIPVLTLYCSTVSSFGFYPYNSRSRFLSFDDLDCKPCGIHGYQECPVKTFECGHNLTPAQVMTVAEQMISKN